MKHRGHIYIYIYIEREREREREMHGGVKNMDVEEVFE
jgi:hypothetical protein